MKCKKCGFDNIKGGTKCGKCGAYLVVGKISCPKCASINDAENVKCEKCGYNFKKSRKGRVLLNFIISLLLVISLVVLIVLNKVTWVKSISKGFKIGAIFLIVVLVVATILFRRDDALDKNIPELKVTQRKFRKLRIISKFFLLVLVLILLGIGIYYVVKNAN